MFTPQLFAIYLLLATFAASTVSAASGIANLRIRDAKTHWAVRAAVRVSGPDSRDLQTDGTGRLSETLQTGEYRVEVSAPGYRNFKTYFNVTTGTNMVVQNLSM